MGKSSARKKKNANANANANSNNTADAATKTTTSTSGSDNETGQRAVPPAAAANGGGAAMEASVLVRRAQELKEEGNRLFQARDYEGALRQYEQALKLTPRGHPDRAVFHSNRAACLMQMRPVDHEAVAAECSLALQAQPRFPRALLRRARALEALRRSDLALQDVRALLALDPDHRDALDLLRRLSPSPPLPLPPLPAALGASALGASAPAIAGLGPSLPARPIPKKPTPTPKSPPPPPPQNATTNISHIQSDPLPAISKSAAGASLPNGPAAVKLSADKKPPLPSSSAARQWRRRPLKLVYDHDIRLAEMPANCGFRALREVVATRFPSSKSVLIKYRDGDGDLVTITSTAELRLAESCLDQLAASKEGKEDGDEAKEKLRLLRLHIVEVSPEQEPPLPEEEEEEEEEQQQHEEDQEPAQEEEKQDDDDGLVKGDDSLSHSSAAESLSEAVENGVGKAVRMERRQKRSPHPERRNAIIQSLFRNQVGIDPDAHVDLHELGMELCSEALEETVTSEEAQSLFEMAASKFQEVAALAFFNWGNVHMCAARKRIPLDDSSPKEVMAAQLRTAYDWVREKYSLAREKYEEALRIKPDFYEGLLALGQQNFETAKLHWSFALADKADLSSWDYSETIKLFDSAEEKMKAATEMWEKVEEQRVAELKNPGISKKDEIQKKRKKQGAVAEDGPGELTAEEAAEQAAAMRSQIHLFWGNMLFERSQVEFKLGVGDWRKNLDAAIERFKLAGASEADISMVLKNHSSNAGVAEPDEKKAARRDRPAKRGRMNFQSKVLQF
uniref:PB1 domain-containing protein n=1 Tax=Ananas comosus var. bracteatus TaxID=296719 RepID=A0A6V7Q9G0_ANACO|nr:unnamed protein product [Ananas comosus var. bracteatus]